MREAIAVLTLLSVAGVVRAQEDAAIVVDGEEASSAEVRSGARTATLSWVRLPGAESCPSTQELSRAVEARLGRRVFVAASDSELAVEGRIEPEGGGFRATFTVADASGATLGERVLDHAATECADALELLALTIALMVDPEASLAPSELPALDEEPEPELREVEPVVAEEADETPVLTLADDEAPRRRAAREDEAREDETHEAERAPDVGPARWLVDVTLSLGGSAGLSPSVAPGGTLTIAVTPPTFIPIVLHGALFPWSRAQPDAAPMIDVLQGYAGIELCPLAVRDIPPFAFFVCAGVDVGAFVTLTSRDAVTEPERVTIQGHVEARGRVAVAGPLAIDAALALLVPFRADPFFLAEPTPRAWYTPEPVAGVLSVGATLAF